MPIGIRSSDSPPFYDLDEYDFQKLCCDLFSEEADISTSHVYGTRGQSQYGIDILAHRKIDEGIEVGQCKCYKDFTPKDIRDASEEFFKNWSYWANKNVKSFILFVASDLTTRQRQDEIIKQKQRFNKKHLHYEVWSAEQIRNKLRHHPGIVASYLEPAEHWLKVICGELPEKTQKMTDHAMTLASAKVFLFDTLAEQLATQFTGFPSRIALRLAGNHGFQNEELISLASSLCRLRFPSLDNIPTCFLNALSDSEQSRGIIVDAMEKTLFEVITGLNLIRQQPEILVVINYCDDGSGQMTQISYNPEQDRDITKTALLSLCQQLGKEFEFMALIRFVRDGFNGFANYYSLFEQKTRLNWGSEEDIERCCYRVSEGWRYEGQLISSLEVLEWVNQFKPAGFVQEACDILIYLKRYGFLTEEEVIKGIIDCYNKHVENIGKPPITITLQAAGTSEQKIADHIQQEIKRPFLSLEETIAQVQEKTSHYPVEMVCFDDMICSGQNLRDFLFEPKYNFYALELIELFKQGTARLTVLVSHADEKGIRALCTDSRGYGAVSVKATCVIDDRYRAFHPDGPIFSEHSRMVEFQHYCKKIGQQINPGNPLGQNNAQWCIVTEYRVPNCSLPILFASGKDEFHWKPLFPIKSMY